MGPRNPYDNYEPEGDPDEYMDLADDDFEDDEDEDIYWEDDLDDEDDLD